MSTPTEWQWAYDLAHEALRRGRGLLDAKPLLHASHAENVSHLAELRAELCTTDQPRPKIGFGAELGRLALDPVALQVLCWEAESDPVAWAACGVIAKRLREARRPLPDPLADLLTRAFEKTFSETKTTQIPSDLQGKEGQKPIPRGRKSMANYGRDIALRGAVATLVRAGVTATRNRHSKRDDRAPSACQIVSDCAIYHGLAIGELAVEKVWQALPR